MDYKDKILALCVNNQSELRTTPSGVQLRECLVKIPGGGEMLVALEAKTVTPFSAKIGLSSDGLRDEYERLSKITTQIMCEVSWIRLPGERRPTYNPTESEMENFFEGIKI